MKFTLIIVIIFILYNIFNYLIYRKERNAFLKAGKRWDEIVNELSKRK